jgi:phosphoribosylglycinamide formyltransferase 1
MASLDLGVLVSGSGTNLQAILDAVRDGRLDASVRVVVSNRAEAQGLARAAAAGVATRVMSHRDYPDRPSFDRALVAVLRDAGARWVVLAGFMRIVTAELLDAFPQRVINIHPSLLPAFPGVDAQAQALAYGVRVSGCTVHLVDAGTDTGPIIAQRAVPVLDGDDRAALAARILEQEHALLVEVLQGVAAGRLRVEQGEGGRPRAHVAPAEGHDGGRGAP